MQALFSKRRSVQRVSFTTEAERGEVAVRGACMERRVDPVSKWCRSYSRLSVDCVRRKTCGAGRKQAGPSDPRL